jgi:hypothetical protein
MKARHLRLTDVFDWIMN